jgi:hypothetical protein
LEEHLAAYETALHDFERVLDRAKQEQAGLKDPVGRPVRRDEVTKAILGFLAKFIDETGRVSPAEHALSFVDPVGQFYGQAHVSREEISAHYQKVWNNRRLSHVSEPDKARIFILEDGARYFVRMPFSYDDVSKSGGLSGRTLVLAVIIIKDGKAQGIDFIDAQPLVITAPTYVKSSFLDQELDEEDRVAAEAKEQQAKDGSSPEQKSLGIVEQTVPAPSAPATAYPQERVTGMQGGIDNRGRSSIASLGTPQGRYEKAVQDAIWFEVVLLSQGAE